MDINYSFLFTFETKISRSHNIRQPSKPKTEQESKGSKSQKKEQTFFPPHTYFFKFSSIWVINNTKSFSRVKHSCTTSICDLCTNLCFNTVHAKEKKPGKKPQNFDWGCILKILRWKTIGENLSPFQGLFMVQNKKVSKKKLLEVPCLWKTEKSINWLAIKGRQTWLPFPLLILPVGHFLCML